MQKQSLICVNELQQKQQQLQQQQHEQQQQQSRYCLHSYNLSVCLSISSLTNYEAELVDIWDIARQTEASFIRTFS